MPFEPVQSEKLSSAVVRQIELLILRGILRPNERLPSERELAEQFGVSRPSLRDAVSELQDKGLLTARAGAGIYVADMLGSAFNKSLVTLFSTHQEAVFDYIDFRRDMEGLAAARACTHGSNTDLEIINTIFEKMEAAHSKRNASDEAKLDADFHMAIVEASHNIIMLHMMRSMFDLLKDGVFYNRTVMFKQRIRRDTLLDQHRAINSAIQSRDADAAKTAVNDHLTYVQGSLAAQQKSEAHEVIAKKRLLQEQTRTKKSP